MKTEQRELVRELRREHGHSIRDLAALVGVSVSSVSLWVRDVPLTTEQEAALAARDPVRSGRRTGTLRSMARRREERLAAQDHGRALARSGDASFIAGCMLYWAEGAKTRNNAILVNADPDLLRAFVEFLRRHYDIPVERFALSVNCFLNNGLALDEIEAWWLDRLGLDAGCLRKAAVNRASSASRARRGKVLVYGTARIAVHSTFVVQSIYGAIQEYAGIQRPEWLDL